MYVDVEYETRQAKEKKKREVYGGRMSKGGLEEKKK